MKFYLFLCLTLVMSLAMPRPAQAELSLLGGLGVPLVDFPIGNFNDVDKFGAGLQLKYLNPVAPFVSVGATVGYYKYSGSRITVGSASLDNFGYTTIPILLTAQVKPPTPGFKPYAKLGGGLYYTSVESGVFTGNVPILGTFNNFTLPNFRTFDFGISPGAGMMMSIVPGIVSFEVQAALHVVFTPVRSTTFFSFLGGFSFGVL